MDDSRPVRFVPTEWISCPAAELPFLFALLAAPFDPAARAGYADWLFAAGRWVEAAVQRVTWRPTDGHRANRDAVLYLVPAAGWPADLNQQTVAARAQLGRGLAVYALAAAPGPGGWPGWFAPRAEVVWQSAAEVVWQSASAATGMTNGPMAVATGGHAPWEPWRGRSR